MEDQEAVTAATVQPQPTPPPAVKPPEPDRAGYDLIQQAIAKADKESPIEGESDGEPEAAAAAEAAPAAAASPEEQRHSQRIAELARREMLIRQNERKLKQQTADSHHRVEEEVRKAEQQRKAAMVEQLKADPFGTLRNEYGLDILDVLASASGQDAGKREQDRVAVLEAKLEALEKERNESTKRAEEERQKAQHEHVYGNALSAIQRVISADPEAHEAILDQGNTGTRRVFDALNAMYEELVERGYSPGPPSNDDILAAAKIVEDATRQEELEELRRKAERKRFSGRLTFGEPTIAAATAKAPQASTSLPKSPTTTLSGKLQGTAPARRELLTPQERLQAAMKIQPPTEEDETGETLS